MIGSRALCALVLIVGWGCSSGTLVRAPMEKPGSGGGLPGDAGPTSSAMIADADAIVGKWTGQGIMSNGRRSDIALDIAASDGTLTVRVSYPQLQCGGEWRLGSSGSHSWSGIENIAYGTSMCATLGFVSVRASGDQLEFDWRDSAGGGVTAHGSLRRVRR